MEIERISPALEKLQHELHHHGDLASEYRLELLGEKDRQLQEGESIDNFGGAIGFIAAKVGFALDGDYSMEDLDEVYDRIRERLEERRLKRAGIIVGD